jgi:hypothetical protein
MPLLDHFHPPFSGTRHWQSFHSRWASALADMLNESLLPEGYYAEEQVHIGGRVDVVRVEIDVARFDEEEFARRHPRPGGTLVAGLRAWAPPVPDFVIPAVFPDSVGVLVFSEEGGPNLVAAFELVSPANKDRPETRRAFAAKCLGYLQQGVGLVIVDIVTSRAANLHNELMTLMNAPGGSALSDRPLYATAYRPMRPSEQIEQVGMWLRSLKPDQSLPAMPLAIDKGVVLALDLESSYTEARRRRRLD